MRLRRSTLQRASGSPTNDNNRLEARSVSQRLTAMRGAKGAS